MANGTPTSGISNHFFVALPLLSLGMLFASYMTGSLNPSAWISLIFTTFAYMGLLICIDASRRGIPADETVLYVLTTVIGLFGSVLYLMQKENNKRVFSNSILVAVCIFVLLPVGDTMMRHGGVPKEFWGGLNSVLSSPVAFLLTNFRENWLLWTTTVVGLPLALLGPTIARGFIAGFGGKSFGVVLLVNLAFWVAVLVLGLIQASSLTWSSKGLAWAVVTLGHVSVLAVFLWSYWLALKLPR